MRYHGKQNFGKSRPVRATKMSNEILSAIGRGKQPNASTSAATVAQKEQRQFARATSEQNVRRERGIFLILFEKH